MKRPLILTISILLSLILMPDIALATQFWGWHTGIAPTVSGLTNAVTGKVNDGDDWARGNPAKWEYMTSNMAFVLISTQPESTTETKWQQTSDMDTGLDLLSQWDYTDNYPDVIKADDWICSNGLPITDFQWWGSYYDNIQFAPNAFFLNIYANNGMGTPTDPSDDIPGDWLWGVVASFSGTNETYFNTDGADEKVYSYSLSMPENFGFDQKQDGKYWLSIVASTPSDSNTSIPEPTTLLLLGLGLIGLAEVRRKFQK